MKITGAKLIVCSPGRNFVTLKLTTDEGIYGLGDATLNGREKAVATYLEEYCLPSLTGRDPFDTEDTWQYFYRSPYWKRGPVTMTAIAAIDMALWDIKAKALKVPLYKLLGGKTREKILVYCHANGRNAGEALDDVGRHMELGYKAIRVQSGVPGVRDSYGVPRHGEKYEPALRDQLPKEGRWDTEKYLRFAPTLFDEIRSAYGEDLHLLHDVHHRLKPVEAARLGKELEPFRLFWIEDAIPADLQEGFRLIRHHTVTPLAVGEVFNSVHDCHTLITEQLIDYIRMTIVHGGGITPLLKLANLAALYHVRTGFHGATDLSPVTMAAALHFDLAIHNFGIQEHMPHSELTDEVFPHAYSYKDGYMYPGDAPGLGVDLNEELAAKYPYERAWLPANRLEDGTMWDW
ncbi:D-mannonate dehydratase [Anseongella ginsenosidimutans]|uniref:D-mannonate dehydratase n=1 Tax=Anseongella ginsenosidimutans TaxID=496056 RepID=A0A4R3KU99_9SPHI|nr:D-mannonate dehydratase ManD [Anseongella ginsenosidimutans]QEC51626.1 D-galactonate dehydratase family protein [Anseongella ginsenosidimutans]TCS88959.1 D-mannonate dehydratase [Anseongella ginsenosidimutans]